MCNAGFTVLVPQSLMVELTLGKLLTFLRGAAQSQMRAMDACLQTSLLWN